MNSKNKVENSIFNTVYLSSLFRRVLINFWKKEAEHFFDFLGKEEKKRNQITAGRSCLNKVHVRHDHYPKESYETQLFPAVSLFL